MKYTASLDIPAKLITVAVIIIIMLLIYQTIAIDITTHFGSGWPVVILLLIGALILSYVYAPKAYLLDDKYLTVVRTGGNRSFELSNIAEVTMVPDGSVIWAFRLFAVGGVFGYYGKFWSFKLGSVTYYNTKRYNRVLITTNEGQKIMITPDDMRIADDLKAKLAIKP